MRMHELTRLSVLGMLSIQWLLLLLAVVHVDANNARSVYFMDKKTDCDFVGTWFVGRDQTITVVGRSPGQGNTLSGCTINFKAVDSDAKLELVFLSYILKSCEVYIYLSGDGSGEPRKYGCDEVNPRDYYTTGRGLTFTLHKIDVTTINYNFSAKLIAKRDNLYPPPGDSNPMAVGMVVGVVASIFVVIIVISLIGICCFRKYRARGPSHSPYLHDPNSKVKLEDTPTSNGGYFNESAKFTGSPMAKKKLLSHSDSSDERTNSDHSSRHRGFSTNSSVPVPPPPPPPSGDKSTPNGRNGRDVFTFENDRQLGRNNERGVDVDSQPRNSMLSALHGNRKFKNTFKSTEAEADERAKRISSTSSFENFGDAPNPPSSKENKSRPSLPPVPKSPKGKKQKTAGISRTPRPTSMSSEELEEIERGRPRDDDRNIRVMQNDSSSPGSEVVPIKLPEQNKKKTNTTHSLRPDRKAPRSKNKNQSTSNNQDQRPNKRETQSVSSVFDPEPPRPSPREQRRRGLGTDRVRDADRLNDSCDSRNSSGRFSKRARRSPRPGNRSGRGFNHRRGRSVDHLDSRPVTPTSAFGSMEDLESLPPLQRASSKNSLYASRSSLYDRRRRRGSTTESVHSMHSMFRGTSGYSSYSDEDFDGYEKPLSRRDRERLYRSENDLGRGRREISTQTLRETATQTGAGESVIMQPKMLVKKKKKTRKMSTSSTQTDKKKNDVKKSKSKAEEKLSNRNETAEKRKSKRSKSLNELDVETTAESPKPRPKPRPRKSTSAGKMLDSDKRSASADNLLKMQENPYVPASEGFVPTGYNPAAGYPMIPPGYPVPPYPGQPPYMGQYPPQPMQGVPPGYMYPQQPPPPQPPMNRPIPQTKPTPPRKKSNWEILCEMTDGEYQRDDVTETGSVASSVFTNNPHSANNYGVQAGPQPPYLTNSYPSQQYGQPAYNGNQQNYKNIPPPQDSTIAGKQSSWEALKSMTEPTIQQPSQQQQASNRRNESVV